MNKIKNTVCKLSDLTSGQIINLEAAMPESNYFNYDASEVVIGFHEYDAGTWYFDPKLKIVTYTEMMGLLGATMNNIKNVMCRSSKLQKWQRIHIVSLAPDDGFTDYIANERYIGFNAAGTFVAWCGNWFGRVVTYETMVSLLTEQATLSTEEQLKLLRQDVDKLMAVPSNTQTPEESFVKAYTTWANLPITRISLAQYMITQGWVNNS
jgi:ribosomal protein L30E